MNLPPPSPNQARVIWSALTATAVGLMIALAIAFIWGLSWIVGILSPVLLPIAVGGVVAYILDPLVDFLGRRRIERNPAIILVFTLGAGIVLAVFAIVVPRLVLETGQLVNKAPAYARAVQEKVSEWVSHKPTVLQWLEQSIPARFRSHSTNEIIEGSRTNRSEASINTFPGAPGEIADRPIDTAAADKMTEAAIKWLGNVLPKAPAWLLAQRSHVTSFFEMLVGLALIPVFSYYFLKEKKAISESWTDYLPVQESRFKRELVFVLNAINSYLIVFFRGQVLIALCDGVLFTVGFSILGLSYSLLIGLVAGAFSIIPYLGTIVTIVPTFALAVFQFRDAWHPALVLGIFAGVHLLEGLVISPKIMGNRVGLPPVTIIIALLMGTTLFGGILGGVLAIPLTAALRVVMFRYVWKKQRIH